MNSGDLVELFRSAVTEVEAANERLHFVTPESVLLTLVNGLIAIKQAEEQESADLRSQLATPAFGGPRAV